MTEEIIAIATTINGRVNYVTGTSTRHDNRLIPIFGIDPEQAHDFGTMPHANSQATRFINYHNRTFTAIVLTVPVVTKKTKNHTEHERIE